VGPDIDGGFIIPGGPDIEEGAVFIIPGGLAKGEGLEFIIP